MWYDSKYDVSNYLVMYDVLRLYVIILLFNAERPMRDAAGFITSCRRRIRDAAGADVRMHGRYVRRRSARGHAQPAGR